MKKRTFFAVIWGIIAVSSVQGQSSKYPCEIEISKKADKIYKQARAAVSKGENDKATTLYKQCVAEQDDWAAPYFHLGMQAIRKLEQSAEKKDNLFQTAINYFEKVVEHCPQYNVLVYFHLGKLYYSIGEYGKAVKYLELFL